MTPFTPRTKRTSLARQAAAWLMAGCALVLPDSVSAQALLPASGEATATGTSNAVTLPGAAPAQDAAITTGSISTDAGEPLLNDPMVDEDMARTNLRENTVDGLRSQLDIDRNDAQGIRLGSFTLKPTLGQSYNFESNKTGNSKENRSYLETGLKGTLTSDWSRHQLTVTGEGTWQRNVSGTGETEPTADVEAALRLDLSEQTTATLKAGYHFEREDSTDPNAISNASVQSGIDQYTLGAGIERDFGILRGSAKIDFDRYVYGDAELDNGGTLSMKDRNRNAGALTVRVGYELSPALIPFIEASAGKSIYDLRRDTLGFERSYDSYGARAGIEADLGEKLNGEIALGYQTYRFDDNRLDELKGFTIDGLINWSPQRGTDIAYGISTGIEPSTTAGESGAMVYTLSSRATHELRTALVARLSNSLTFRNFQSGSSDDEKVWLTGAGLTWDLNRYLALTGDVSYEHTTRDSGPATNIARVGVGLTLRR
ncbi:outer membrane beta-barrel protein [Pararhizobium sp. YC-54]|uniref:outer membrane beta-barrel protein n=1 Tax=Pararhizobium sp. YC-54 TaxID=2986920 RepID=UPI0021F76985|nr:outer membrane beta-barrel protein [Pararhizobium sp. YC-54]MCV9998433.1 outer membrane beta-barrel protein [Pararhizobium sp. YC-54]